MPNIRTVISGVVAGVVIFLLYGGLHFTVLSADWQAFAEQSRAWAHPPGMGSSMMLWLAMGLCLGIGGATCLAALRANGGLGTAIAVGFGLWFVGPLPRALNQIATGLSPDRITVIDAAGGLVFMVIAMIVAALIQGRRGG